MGTNERRHRPPLLGAVSMAAFVAPGIGEGSRWGRPAAADGHDQISG